MLSSEEVVSDAAEQLEQEATEEAQDQSADNESPAELTSLQKAHYERIQELEVQCEELEQDFNEKNSRAKSAKRKWEDKVEELRGCIREGPDDQHRLPFGDDDSTKDGAGEAWAETPISDALTLTDKQREKLEDADIKTVGEFERLRAGTPDHPRGLQDLPRVGQATVDKWEEEILDWLAKNQPATDEEESEAGDAEPTLAEMAGGVS